MHKFQNRLPGICLKQARSHDFALWRHRSCEGELFLIKVDDLFSSPSTGVHIFGIFEAHSTLLAERSVTILNIPGPTSKQSQSFSVKKSTHSTIRGMAPAPSYLAPFLRYSVRVYIGQ